MPLLTCPAAALPTIKSNFCLFAADYMAGFVVQRVFSSGTTRNEFTAVNDPTLLASWAPLLQATDGTKVAPSHEVDLIAPEGGEVKLEDVGDKQIENGISETRFACTMKKRALDDMNAMSQIKNEQGGIYIIYKNGLIGAWADDPATPAAWRPIPWSLFAVSEQIQGTSEASASHMVHINLPAGWTKNLVLIEPADFNAHYDLLNTTP